MSYFNVLPGTKQLFDSDGVPLDGGFVYVYDAGTTTPKDSYPTYDDAVAGTNANANPVELDSSGRANIWISGNAKITVKDSALATIYTEDDINPDQSQDVSQVYPGRLGAATNLAGARASVTQVTFTADKIALLDSSDQAVVRSSMNITAAITASGANGLDTGVEANSTWYYVWAIWNGATLSALLSTSATAPTLPSGYTYKALIGCVYNDSGGDFDDFIQRGDRVAIDENTVLSNGTSATWASVSLAAIIPPIAKEVYGSLQAARSSGTSSFRGEVSPAGSDVGKSRLQQPSQSASATEEMQSNFSLIITTAQTMYYQCPTSNTTLDIQITGFRY